MKNNKSGVTLVELLVVLGIITLLVGILVPALNMVNTKAKETKQFAQFTAINLGLTTFKNDYGDYPPSEGGELSSDRQNVSYYNYCGAQKLTEALLGWDLLGFHPRSSFIAADGKNNNGEYIYDVNDPVFFDQREDPYLEFSSSDVIRLGDLFNNTSPLAANTYVLCDAFSRTKIQLFNGETVNAGSPILYYRANTTEKTIGGIYNPLDNDAIIRIRERADNRTESMHPLGNPNPDNTYEYFYNYIRDPKITVRPWPYKPDSYLLISAGADGLYGTSDDICNFGN